MNTKILPNFQICISVPLTVKKIIMQIKRTNSVKRIMFLRNIDLHELALSFFYKNAKISASLKNIIKTEVLSLE